MRIIMQDKEMTFDKLPKTETHFGNAENKRITICLNTV